MNLPGRLRTSTLGDILGTLHRGRVSGVLALREVSGATAGRIHRIYLRAGLVMTIETLRPGAERAGRELSPMSRAEVKERLDALFKLTDADITFHVASAKPEAEPLAPAEFLHGRPRARDRKAPPRKPRGPELFPQGSSDEPPPVSEPPLATLRRRALATLGLPHDATVGDVQKAFKRLALRVHPDRHPEADDREREELSAHFARLTQAYHVLMA